MTSFLDPILLVDDDPEILRSTKQVLEGNLQQSCVAVPTAGEALALVKESRFSTILLDLGLPDRPGQDVLAQLRREVPEVPVLIVTALADVDVAVRCMTAGAYDYVVKGSDPARLLHSVKRALESREKDLRIAALAAGFQSRGPRHPEHFAEILTGNERMRGLFRFIEAIAGSDEPVLLQGETGTGKELFARAIHKASGVKGPFVATNLGGLEDLLVSDTLFGHVKGAYTGADEPRKGLVFQAAGGTLFLDEIGDLSPQSQVKLLRFLENREYFPLGTDLARRSEARVVVATHRNLEARADQGLFRRDLLYRLSTYRIDIPPLRERREDLALLCGHFLGQVGQDPRGLTSEALITLGRYLFPGNIRELRGLLLRAVALSPDGVIGSGVVESLLAAPTPSSAESSVPAASGAKPVPTIQEAISNLIQEALLQTNGHQSQAAKLLGISPQALSKRLKQREV